MIRLLLAFLISAVPAWAATVAASTCSRTDVGTAYASTVDGDTLAIPPGTCTWTTTINFAKSITIQGAGVGVTIIRDGVSSPDTLITLTPPANKAIRLTAIEFQDGGRASTQSLPGIIAISGSTSDGRTARIDNCEFDGLNGFAICPFNTIGVIDHNEFVFSGANIPVYIFNNNWGGTNYGDGSYAAPPDLGGNQFLFLENNTFTYQTGARYAAIDCYMGARFVVRFNTFTRCWIEIHGTESGGRNRGGRAIEVYNNTFDGGSVVGEATIVSYRSGTGVVFNNTATNFLSTPAIRMIADRLFFPFSPWGAADGENPWDKNDAGSPFATGTAAVGISTTSFVRVAGAAYTTDQWVGYVIRKTSACSTQQCASIITSNTSNEIFFETTNGFGTELSFSAGETFEINKVTEALDQPGRGQGSLITGDTPSVPVGWNDQVTEALYEWNNLHGASDIDFAPRWSTLIRSGEHYHNDTTKPGYVPYTYPHPLTQPGGVPRPPSMLRFFFP